ncbi:MAG: outer membrane beta-barrel protein [Burkholderiales bacterium]|nr:outer membrane beta-barrel protein [Burkholderiales bacterium]
MPRTMSAATLLLLVVAADAAAQSSKVLTPYVNVSYSHDSNLFRVADAQVQNPDEPRGDSSLQTVVGLAFEKEVGLQKFTGRVGLSHSNYSHYKMLDFDSRDAQANWKWRVGSHLWGNIGASTDNTLTPYTEFHENVRNLRLQKRANADLVWLFHPSWRIRGGVSGNKLEYDLDKQKFKNRTQTQTEFGLDYLPISGNIIGVVMRHGEDKFPNAEQFQSQNVINNKKTDELKLRLDWRVTGKTQVQVLAGMVKQKHEVLPQRDFQGANGRVTVIWAPTGKIEMTGVVWHEIDATDNLTTNYQITNGLRLAPTMSISAKMRLEGLLRYEKRTPIGIQGINFNQVDKFSSAGLTLTYAPIAKMQMSAALSHDNLSSNLVLRDYRATAVTFSAYYEY